MGDFTLTEKRDCVIEVYKEALISLEKKSIPPTDSAILKEMGVVIGFKSLYEATHDN